MSLVMICAALGWSSLVVHLIQTYNVDCTVVSASGYDTFDFAGMSLTPPNKFTYQKPVRDYFGD